MGRWVAHQLSEMGHSSLLVTQTLTGDDHAVASAAPAAYLKRPSSDQIDR
jgi:hypothetical protein